MRTRLFCISIMALAAACLPGTQAAANLLVNGSFEDATNFLDNTGQDTMNVDLGSTAMTGWTVTGSHFVSWIGPGNPFLLTASNGGYFVDLTGYLHGAPFGGVSQTISTTAGATYQLRFDLGSSSIYGLPSGITASAGSSSQTFTSADTGANNWETETFDFVAGGPTTTISFLGDQGLEYTGLDNVSVALAMQEPVSFGVLAAGLAALGTARYRRR